MDRRRTHAGLLAGLAVVALAATAVPAQAATTTPGLHLLAGTISRVDRSHSGSAPRGGAYAIEPNGVSANGRYVLMASYSTAIEPGHTGNFADLYVEDMVSGSVRRVGTQLDINGLGVGAFDVAAISANGRYVAYLGLKSGSNEVYRFDTKTGHTRIESLNAAGAPSTGNIISVGISANGRYVVYDSNATDMAGGADNGHFHLYRYDSHTDQTTLIDRAVTGGETDNDSWNPSISNDGRYVAYESYATDLVDPSPGATFGEVYLTDLDSTTGNGTTLISHTSSGAPDPRGSHWPSISANGSAVVFQSSTGLGASPIDQGWPIYRYDTGSGTLALISDPNDSQDGTYAGSHASISGNGRFIAYSLQKTSRNFIGEPEILRYDSETGISSLVYRPEAKVYDNNPNNATISADGHHIVFDDIQPPITDPGDKNQDFDVYEWNQVPPH